MAARKTKTVEDYEKELAEERAKWEEKRKSIESKITEVKKEQQKKEDAAKAKAERLIGEEVLASLDASADAAIARVDVYYARVHPKK